ncbi:UDP-3-O-[3-hydroxymyristoyl] N-acetylglucosamine deacetylase [hydrothermal vent metagenome]|uniref:UDP-3-O-acyl-N-acetylglucosamine deacetylase n=1 Tax=hydrothermal vent metagenome TaxID=652676 RepID=A0A1W1BUE9_9ZZZZ
MLAQRTIKNSVSARGVALHSGKISSITFKPAEINTGIVFRRVDLKNKEMKAHSSLVNEVSLCTSLEKQGMKIATVEHLLSALSALGIDNLIVEINSEEIPIMDGSASQFIFLIEAAGIKEQEDYKKFFVIKKEIRVRNGISWAKVKPFNGFKIDVEIDFDNKAVKDSGQNLAIDFSKESYLKEISRARTFGYISDIEKMKSNDLALGASVDNAIGLSENGFLNGQRLRYKNEFVKHKILDVVGDLYLLGGSLLAEYQGYRVGHALNNILLNEILKDKSNYEVQTFEKDNAPIIFISTDDIF